MPIRSGALQYWVRVGGSSSFGTSSNVAAWAASIVWKMLGGPTRSFLSSSWSSQLDESKALGGVLTLMHLWEGFRVLRRHGIPIFTLLVGRDGEEPGGFGKPGGGGGRHGLQICASWVCEERVAPSLLGFGEMFAGVMFVEGVVE